MITLEIGVADLAASRFAVSPLCETVRAVQLLADPDHASVNAPWLRWAQARLAARPVRLARTWPLIVTGLDYFPEFLVPAPAVRAPDFATEADRLRATPPAAVRASLERVFAGVPWPASAVELAERPAESLREIAGELTVLHDRLIAPHWERMRAVLDADIAYRSEVLASGGARALFGGLHEDLRWTASPRPGTLELSDGQERVLSVALGPGGLVLVPGVLTWPRMNTRMATSSQTTMHYPARGAATVWLGESGTRAGAGAGPGTGPAAALLGGTRARLLDTLRSPATTTSLARALGVTPGAVSQHLTVLYRGGLVDRSRSGREVLYQVSDLGLALLEQPRRPSTAPALNSDKLGDTFNDMRSAPPVLLPILRSQVAGDLLALLYLHPDDEYSLTEAATAIGASLNAVHHEATKLSDGGLIRTRRRGNLRLIRAITDSLLTRPLTDLLAVTYGPLPVLRDLIVDIEGVAEAYIYGSWAARYRGEPGPVPVDVDVLIVGAPDPDDLDEVAEKAETRLRRPVNVRRLRPETWNASDPSDPFIGSVKSRPLVKIVESSPA